jgi:hypothetical protein
MAFKGPKFEYEDPIDGTTTILIDLPAEGDPIRERIRTRDRTQESATGIEQTLYYYDEVEYEVRLIFLSKAKINELRKFYYRFANRGGKFKWYPDQDEPEFFTCSLRTKEFRPQRIRSDGAGDFEYDLRIRMRSLDKIPIV